MILRSGGPHGRFAASGQIFKDHQSDRWSLKIWLGEGALNGKCIDFLRVFVPLAA